MMVSSRANVTLITIFLLALLLVICTRELRKTLIYSDIFTEWKASTQQFYASERLLNLGIEVVKDNFDYLFDVVEHQEVVEIPLELPEYCILRRFLRTSDKCFLLLKQLKRKLAIKTRALHLYLCFVMGQSIETSASCLLVKVNNDESNKQPSFMVDYYTVGIVV